MASAAAIPPRSRRPERPFSRRERLLLLTDIVTLPFVARLVARGSRSDECPADHVAPIE